MTAAAVVTMLAKIIGLTLVFLASTGASGPEDVVLASLVGLALVAALPGRRRVGWRRRTGSLTAAARLAALVAVEMVRGTFQVAAVIVGLRPARPGVVEVAIEGWSREAVLLAGFLLSVSPGSYVLAADWPRSRLIVHLLDATDPEVAARRLVERYDRYQRHFLP